MSKKVQQLGMCYGTAQKRLVKQLLLHLAQQLGQDFCYRCKQRIETAKELSIDHKVDWLDVSTELFWDLHNLAFSHLSCNVRASRQNKSGHAPDGQGWCAGHKAYLDVAMFNANRARVCGLQHYCKECDKKFK